MFAVGVNLRPQAFLDVFRHPAYVAVGSLGQWLVKPLLGLLIAQVSVALLHLPPAVGTGLVLVGTATRNVQTYIPTCLEC